MTRWMSRPAGGLPGLAIPRPPRDDAGVHEETIPVDGDHLALGPDQMPTVLRPWSGDVFTWHLPEGDDRLVGDEPVERSFTHRPS